MKRILKVIFASVLAMALTLPALSGCGSNSPKDELGEAEGEQIVITPSEETENGGALCMSVSEVLEGQAGLETRQVRAQTTPANIPVDWELLWLSVQHSAGAVTDYLSYTFAATIITDGVKWSNRINLTLLERFEGTAMLRVSLKSDPTILDYVTIKAELPKPSIERTVTVSSTSAAEISLNELAKTAPAIFSVDCIYQITTGTGIPYADVKAVFSNGEEVSLNCTYYATNETTENGKYERRYVYQLRVTRTDMTKIMIGGTEATIGGTAQLTISCTPIGTQAVDTEKNLTTAANRVIDFAAGEAIGGYSNSHLRIVGFLLKNLPATNYFTIEIYYECVVPYEGEFEAKSSIRYKEANILPVSYQNNLTTNGNFAISTWKVSDSFTIIDFRTSITILNDYAHDTNTKFMNVKIFFYEGEFDPTYVPSRYAV